MAGICSTCHLSKVALLLGSSARGAIVPSRKQSHSLSGSLSTTPHTHQWHLPEETLEIPTLISSEASAPVTFNYFLFMKSSQKMITNSLFPLVKFRSASEQALRQDHIPKFSGSRKWIYRIIALSFVLCLLLWSILFPPCCD
jgi:hypothetical protein